MTKEKLEEKFKNSSLVVSAGMPRSGSTLLFNILREILSSKWAGQVSAGWVDDISELPKNSAYLIKVHDFNSYFQAHADHSFYTYRDVRVAAVSAAKKFGRTPTVESIRENLNQYLLAKRTCDLVIKYDDLISSPVFFVRQIAKILGASIDVDDIIKEAFYLQPPEKDEVNGAYSKKTLLHEKHFTHTGDDEWRDFLSDRLQRDISGEFSWWFEECGYPAK